VVARRRTFVETVGWFAMLSHREQVARLRRLAVRALDSFPLVDPQLRFIAHGENTTFRVDASIDDGSLGAPERRERFLLRVHRPARHGRRVDSSIAIRSELRWLTALREDTDLLVPEPLLTRDGDLVTTVASAEVPEPRVCSVVRWMDGRIHADSPRPVHLHRLGGAMARLHNHADQWVPPTDFVRIRWDWHAFFGDSLEYGGINAAQCWELIPDDLQAKFHQVASLVNGLMTQLGDGPGIFGLIHADLHLENALFLRGDVRLIDFDDCGFGYRLYDIAVALWELRHRDDYESFRTALVAGYTERRPLPIEHLAHLDAFIAAREVAVGLWFAGTAQVNPAFRDDLDHQLASTADSLDVLLRN
jgi:Ser/Thr protein kinase RdoA (MazF antagonist)